VSAPRRMPQDSSSLRPPLYPSVPQVSTSTPSPPISLVAHAV